MPLGEGIFFKRWHQKRYQRKSYYFAAIYSSSVKNGCR